MQRLLLYTSVGCHLCEQALAIVVPQLSRLELELVEIEIANSDELMEHYGLRIPVLRLEGAQEDLGWPFDRDDFTRYVEAAGEAV